MPKRYLTILCGLLSLMMIVLAGCQTVGGIDLNKVFLNGLNIQSYEGEETITVDFTFNPQTDHGPVKADLSLFKSIKLSLTNIKEQDPKQLSADGAFTYATGTIPFKLNLTEDQAVLQIEGAKKPLVLDLKAVRGQSGLVVSPVFLNDQQKVIKELAPFIVDKLPNPKTVKVEPSSVTVGPDTLNANKLHAEIKGNELVDLVKTTIANLLSDEKSLQDFAQQAVKLILGDRYTPVIGEIARTQAKEYLQQFAASLDQGADNAFLNEGNYLKTDYYIDQDQNIRKSDVELYVSVPGDAGVLKAVKVTVSSAIWNLNKPVTASVIDTKGGSFTFGPNTGTKFLHVIKDLDPSSQAYKLLVKELKATHKDIRLRILPQGKDLYGPYIDAETGTVLVPVRLISDRLDAEVKWNGDKQEITVTDILSDKTIVFTIDSATALVDGQPVSHDSKVVLKNGSAFVPLRFIAETLGAQVVWDNNRQTVNIVKD